MQEKSLVNIDILDLGGGNAQLALLLLKKGAKSVTIIDPSLNEDFCTLHLDKIPNLVYYKGTLEQYLSETDYLKSFGSILACSVTEHIQNLAECLRDVFKILLPKGMLFLAHDNYYHPSGAHDNFILNFDGRSIDYRGPQCWLSPEKCTNSQAFRESLKVNVPWAWNEQDQALLNSDNCENCHFYKRTKPWAHLLNHIEFNQVYRQNFFSTGMKNSGLNKITPFMLRQFLVEAGFKIELWHRNRVENEPPAELLEEPYYFSKIDLQTFNIITRCIKP